jgi:hypothetical protein
MGWTDAIGWGVAPGAAAADALYGAYKNGDLDSIGQWLSGGGEPPVNQQDLPYFQEDRDRIGGMLGGRSAFVNDQISNPYGQDFRSLIGQLQEQAGPGGNDRFSSQAMQNFYAGNQRGMTNQLAMARSGGPGTSPALAGRQAAMGMGRMNQGLSQGMTAARTQERLGAQGALAGVLGGAAQADQGYQGLAATQQRANQQAFLDLLGKQLGLSEGQMRGQLGQPLGQAGPGNLERLIQMLTSAGGTIASF